jgi:hypothetical protein
MADAIRASSPVPEEKLKKAVDEQEPRTVSDFAAALVKKKLLSLENATSFAREANLVSIELQHQIQRDSLYAMRLEIAKGEEYDRKLFHNQEHFDRAAKVFRGPDVCVQKWFEGNGEVLDALGHHKLMGMFKTGEKERMQLSSDKLYLTQRIRAVKRSWKTLIRGTKKHAGTKKKN